MWLKFVLSLKKMGLNLLSLIEKLNSVLDGISKLNKGFKKEFVKGLLAVTTALEVIS